MYPSLTTPAATNCQPNGDMLSKLNKSYYKAAAAQEQKAARTPAKSAKSSQATHGSAKGSAKKPGAPAAPAIKAKSTKPAAPKKRAK